MSADTNARKDGAPVPPLEGPANTSFCAALESENDRAGVVEAVDTEVVNNGLRLPELKVVTVPVPAGISAVTSALKVGAAAEPEVGPAHTMLAF